MTATVGMVMLVHSALGLAEQVAQHWAAAGCPIVILVSRIVPTRAYQRFRAALEGERLISFSRRCRCQWGTWGIVAASQCAAEKMLSLHRSVRHVYLASGSCLPLRPVRTLIDFLDANPRTDFIESAAISDFPWIAEGLGHEQFTLRYPFSWRRNRYLFDRYVKLQRRLKLHRQVPRGLVPHMGSQWWCLTRQTLSAILQDPDGRLSNRFFRQVWIPDESYFQTLAQRYSTRIESRSLALSKFDFQGKPHMFYDDHLSLLWRSDCFVTRKIWPHADRLFHSFLTAEPGNPNDSVSSSVAIIRIFAKAVERRTRGRPGLYMKAGFQSRIGITAEAYSVFFEDFRDWLERTTDARVHGHLFDRERVEFAGGTPVINGALSDSVAVRDYNLDAFLTNLIWNTRGERQCFQFGPNSNQDVVWRMAKDRNAQISVVTGAWALPLFRSNLDFVDIRRKAARLQQIEIRQLDILRSHWTKARVRIWPLADYVEAPIKPLQVILDEISPGTSHRLAEAPRMVDMRGFGQFLQNLRNQGMHPYLMGDFPVDDATPGTRDAQWRKLHLLR